MNLAATDETILNRQTLQRSARRGRVSGDACYAASTFLQSILERHGVKALNAALDKLRSGTWLTQRCRRRWWPWPIAAPSSPSALWGAEEGGEGGWCHAVHA